ncbi:MAG TPA: hypothetical protein VF735_06925 [Pyrinomonadaceae bacterium]|jgi:hypothetical protein
MSYAERTYRTLRVCLLVLALATVVWPETGYSSRLQLLGEVAVPTNADRARPYSPGLFSREAADDSAGASTVAAAAPLTVRYLKRQTSVYDAVPTYQDDTARAGAQTERINTLFETSRYASPCVSQTATRGPPIFV